MFLFWGQLLMPGAFSYNTDTSSKGSSFQSPLATFTGIRETRISPVISNSTLILDCNAANVFAVSLNSNITTLTFANVPPSGTAFGLTLLFTMDGTARTITWGSSVKWAGGTAPTLTSTSGKVDAFVLMSHDGGVTWYAFTSGQNL